MTGSLTQRALQPLTHRRVFEVAIPAFLSGITEPLLSLADVVIMGQLGKEGLQGGVTAGGEIFSMLLWTLGFLRLSTGGFTAQAFGARDDRALFAVLWRGLFVAAIGGLFLAVFGPPITSALNNVLGWQEGLREVMQSYLSIRFLSAPAVLFSFVCFGWLIGQQRTGLVLLLQAFINITNIIISAWFVLDLGWGVEGAAWGSVIASYSGVVLGLGILWFLRVGRGQSIEALADMWHGPTWRKLLTTNTEFFVRSMAFVVSVLFFFRVADWLDQQQGLNSLNADTTAVLWQYMMLIVFGLDAFAVAAEGFAGEAVGAKRPERLRRATRLVFFWCSLTALACCILVFTLGPVTLPLVSKLPDVVSMSVALLPWVAFAGFYMTPPFMYDGIFLGATRAGDMRNSVVVGLVAQVIVTLVAVPFMGVQGLWLSVIGFMGGRGLYLFWRYPALVASIEASGDRETKASA